MAVKKQNADIISAQPTRTYTKNEIKKRYMKNRNIQLSYLVATRRLAARRLSFHLYIYRSRGISIVYKSSDETRSKTHTLRKRGIESQVARSYGGPTRTNTISGEAVYVADDICVGEKSKITAKEKKKGKEERGNIMKGKKRRIRERI